VHGVEVRYFVPNPNAPSRPRTFRNALGDYGSWQATTSHVQTDRLWVAVRTPTVRLKQKTRSSAAGVQRSKKLMTIRLASTILTAAIRGASPEVREWGNAMLREMDFIEGDWAALFWALGSATALFRRLDAPMSNVSDIFSRTQALMQKVKRRTLIGYAVCFVVIVGFGRFTLIFANSLQRLGCGLTVVATLYLAYQVHERRNRKLPSDIRLSPWAIVLVALRNHPRLLSVPDWLRDGVSGVDETHGHYWRLLPRSLRSGGAAKSETGPQVSASNRRTRLAAEGAVVQTGLPSRSKAAISSTGVKPHFTHLPLSA
jgi:hypothetical protein